MQVAQGEGHTYPHRGMLSEGMKLAQGTKISATLHAVYIKDASAYNKILAIKVMLQASKVYLMAAATAAPDEMPHKRPSSRAKRRAMTTLSFDEMAMTSSIMSRFRTLGMNPAPMP